MAEILAELLQDGQNRGRTILIRGFAGLWVRLGVVWAAASFQLAAWQQRKCAAGPRELSRRADVSRWRRRRQYAGGYQIGAAGHDLPGALRRVERGASTSRGLGQPATVVHERTCGGDQIFLFRPAGGDDAHYSRRAE